MFTYDEPSRLHRRALMTLHSGIGWLSFAPSMEEFLWQFDHRLDGTFWLVLLRTAMWSRLLDI